MKLDDPSADAFAVLTAQQIIKRHGEGMCDRCKRWKTLLLRRHVMRVCPECAAWVPQETTPGPGDEPPPMPMD